MLGFFDSKIWSGEYIQVFLDWIALVIIVFGILLAFRVLFSNKKSRVNQAFFFVALSVSLWVLFGFLSDLITQLSIASFFVRLDLLMVSLFFISIYYLSTLLSGGKNLSKSIDFVVIFLVAFISFSIIFTDIIVNRVEIADWGTDIIFGKGKNFFYVLILLLTSLIIWKLISGYRKLGKAEKTRVQYFLVGILIFASCNIVFNVILPTTRNTIEYYQLGDYSAIFLLGFTAYAIIKKKLFDVKVVLVEVLVAIVTVLLFVQVLSARTGLEYTWSIGLFVAFLLIGCLLIRSFRKETNRKEELDREVKKATQKLDERNRHLSALQEITRSITSTLDITKIAEKVAKGIARNLGYIGGFITLIDEKGEKLCVKSFSGNKRVGEILRGAEGLCQDLVDSGSYNLNTQGVLEKRQRVGLDLSDFISPPVSKNDAIEFQRISGIQSIVAVPIVVRDKVLGSIIYTLSKKREEITKEDFLTMQTLASQTGLTISNAKLYSQVDSLNERLKLVLNETPNGKP